MSVFSIKSGYVVAISRYLFLSGPSLVPLTESQELRDTLIEIFLLIQCLRFVTGLLDLEQDSKYKVSMYAKAQKIGLPATFVDIRHEAAHGELPGLDALRISADQALKWLWDEYWRSLRDPREHSCAQTNQDIPLISGNKDETRHRQPEEWKPWQGLWKGEAIGVVPR